MSTLTRQGASRPPGVRASARSERRTSYLDLSLQVKQQSPPSDVDAALGWKGWTDRETIETAVPAELWPEWTDCRFVTASGPQPEGR